ncbi:outer membrane protein [Geobacter sp. DSM 9736]|uniref:outer membrane protein n=1 Tax=Geobacter sp. DSM 9736 TaxID=1277350 RepID=UPI000B50A399|nr:outer membrane beta-barrel protein [Geobacter sp. DSM 9736]SNB48092.1 Opacity protein [Geobacter sp. DSM 9736]
MKNVASFLALVMLLSVASSGIASPLRSGFYAGGFLGASVPEKSEVTTIDFSDDRIFEDRVRWDPGMYIGGMAGYDFGYLRLDGELSYRHSEIGAVTDAEGFRFRNPDGDIGALSMMFSGFLDIHNATAVTPYLGGGIGFSALRLSDTFGVDTRGSVQRVLLYEEDDDTVFAYQAGAGFQIALNEPYSLDIGYRYFGTDTARFGRGTTSETSLRYRSHNGLIGFRVDF